MSYTLEQLAADIRQTLASRPITQCGKALCRFVERAIGDAEFKETNLGSDKTERQTVLYEDSELGFRICVHVYSSPAHTTPHDHGSTWAVYGQVEGTTVMTDWHVIRQATESYPAQVEQILSYKLKPGKAHFYPKGAVHSPRRVGPTKLLRVEGSNLDHITRTPIQAIGWQRL